MRAAKRRIHGAALAALLLVVATASAATKTEPAAGAAGSSSPLLAAVDVALELDQVLDVGAPVAGAAGVALALEAPRSWTYLEDLARFSEDAKWRPEVDVQGLAGGCVGPSARLKTRVRGYQLFRGGNEAVKNSQVPYAARDCEPLRTPRHVGGVFLTTDPLGYVDGPNLYQFALNNPVNYSDPMGLSSADVLSRQRAYRQAGTESIEIDKAQAVNANLSWRFLKSQPRGAKNLPGNLLKGGWQLVRHPVKSATGIYNVLRYPFHYGGIAFESYANASVEEQGEIFGELLAGAALAGFSKTTEAARLGVAIDAAVLGPVAQYELSLVGGWSATAFRAGGVIPAGSGVGTTLLASRGVTFFGDDIAPFVDIDGATLGRSGSLVWFSPLEDTAALRSYSDISRAVGAAPSVENAWLQGRGIFGISFPTRGVGSRVPTGIDAGGYPHFFPGGRTALALPGGGFLRNSTRELVTPGGNSVPAGSVLFEVMEDGTWRVVRRY